MSDTKKMEARLEYLKKVNYAMVHNGKSCVEWCDLTNLSDVGLKDVVVKIGGELLHDAVGGASWVDAGSTVHITDLKVKPDAAKLLALTESIETTMTLEVSVGEEMLLKENYSVELLPMDYWQGMAVKPELLSAFVTPNTSEISAVLVDAAKVLGKLTGNDALDEYQTQDPNRVRAIVGSVYEALAGRGIIYNTPPATFEDGQRIRLVSQVLNDKMGTCLDTTLLMASCLEACGVHPILVLMKNHAFVGAWLIDSYYSHCVGDDASFLLKSSSDGINEIVLVETTSITGTQKVSFEDAVLKAENTLKQNGRDFEMFVDVARCRLEHIRPLPQVKDGQVVVDEGNYKVDTPNVDARITYEQPGEDGKPLTRQQVWERKLLDFTLRNSLLNLKVKGKVIPFVSYNIDQLEDHLQAGEDYSIAECPTDMKNVQAVDVSGVYDSSLYKKELEEVVADGLKHNVLYAYEKKADLESDIKGLFRASRTALEENGANTLFLVLGLLKWFETEKSVKPLYAPILLLPVDIVRKSSTRYVIRTRDEDMILNTTLVEYLRQQFGISISGLNPLPTDDNGIDVKQVFAAIRNYIKEKSRWDLIEESVLGLFSFSKFVMWNDIHNGAAKMMENGIIQTLVTGKLSLTEDELKEVDAREIDKSKEPKTFAVPLDVDSSQLEAVIESDEGKSFILYGPPGSGKSQTITNMIANALYHGKRVLFVAEKMAALEVVQKRLAKVGAGPFCLEMHSNKATKTHFLSQMERTMDIARQATPEEYEATSKKLFEQRQQLIGYMDALHQKHENGLSLYDCISQWLSIKGAAMELPSVKNTTFSMNKGDLKTYAEQLEALDAVFDMTGHPSEHPLKELDIEDTSVGVAAKLKDWIAEAREVLDAFGGSAETVKQLKDIAEKKQAVDAAAALVTKDYDKGVLQENAKALQSEWDEVEHKNFLSKMFAKKGVLNKVKPYKGNVEWDDIPKLTQLLTQYQEAKEVLSGVTNMLEKDLQQVMTVVDALKKVGVAKESLSVGEIRSLLDTWSANAQKAHDWSLWIKKKRELQAEGLDCAIQHIMLHACNGTQTAKALLKAVYERQAIEMIDKEPQLQTFSGLLFEQMIEKYRSMAKEFQELTKKELYAKLASKIPNITLAAASTSEVGILKKNIGSKGRGMTIRQIIDQIPTLLPRLCPCMLMSPISVAQYIDLASEKFDIVMFDEASQMPTSEAVGAIARGKALVCVGDPKQMPPTSFFQTSTFDEENAAFDDMESILDDCIAMSMPSRYLTWHYRSKHESLIAFSNSQYYDGKLFTFPSVDDRQSKVTYVPVDGTYDMGKTRCNKAEAEAIVKEVIRRLSDDELSKRSIGIVSFSKVQQDLIEDTLEKELAKHHELEAKAYEAEEPIFVKNLENVQGDERDVILFSVGYGPDENGKVSMNFGPLNNVGGERRLNVAVSRARYEMMIFSTLRPEQIDLNRSGAKGVEGLKRFLEFAQTGRVAVLSSNSKVEMEDMSSALVDAIAKQVEAMGYRVDKQVGRSNFKVDIAVVNPKDEGTYLLGIMCDGKTYYETKTERDREICQPSVLKMLNWNVMKVWSVDWFLNREAVVKRIKTRIEELLNPTPPSEKQEEEKVSESIKAGTPSSKPSIKSATATVSETSKDAADATTASAAAKPSPTPAPTTAPIDHNLDYKLAKLAKVKSGIPMTELMAKHEAVVKKELSEIISVEQPVTLNWLCKRISEHWQVSNSATLKKWLSQLVVTIPGVYTDAINKNENPIYWSNFEDSIGYDKYRKESERAIDEIPLVEVMNAMKESVEQQVAVPVDDLVKQATKIFGFTRTTPKILASANKAVEMMKKLSWITVDENGIAK